MFEKLVNPCLVRGITDKDLQRFAGKRLSQDGKKPGSKVAAATVLKELREVRAALTYANQWHYLPVVPMLPKVDGFESDKRFVTVEHFDAMLSRLGSDDPAVTKPGDLGFPAAWWWDALLSLLWVAPNRIEAALSLRWENVDLDAGTILTPARSTKQKKDHRACVPPVVVEKLRRIKRFSPLVFHWNYGDSTLYRQFFKLQTAAGIKLVCTGEHEHTGHCHFYKFHDFRRSFATLNDELPASLKQSQMGHSSYATTQRYERYADSRATFANKLYLTPSLQRATVQ
jgi:integrase